MLCPSVLSVSPCAIGTLFLDMSVLWEHLHSYIWSCNILKYFHMGFITKHPSTTSTTDDHNQSHGDYHQMIAITKNYQKFMMWLIKVLYKSCIQHIKYPNIIAKERELEVGLTGWSHTVVVWHGAGCPVQRWLFDIFTISYIQHFSDYWNLFNPFCLFCFVQLPVK